MALKTYLDYAGLKKVLQRFLPGSRKIWHGTQTEWDNLDASEKAKYDQAEISGNSNEGVIYVADTAEEGNMNPVTSNTVAKLKKIKIATPTFATGVTGIAQYHWQHNKCTVLMQGVDVPANFTFNSSFITNLPQAATDAIVQYGVLYVLNWNGSTWQGQQVALTNIPAGDTALKADGNIGDVVNTVRVYGSFTYRTKEWYEGE